MILHGNTEKFVVYDFETTSLSLHYADPWQLSFGIADCKEMKESFNYYIDIPNLVIPDFIKKMTHFNEEEFNDLKVAPKIALEHFESYLYNPAYNNVGQNILGFDIYILATLQRHCGKKPDYSFLERAWDTRTLGRAWKDGAKKPSSRKDYIYWQYKLLHDKTNRRNSVSLSALAKDLSVPYDANKHHDARYDIDLTFEVFKKLAKLLNL